MKIRPADKRNDYEEVWDIFSKVVASGDTYAFDPETPKADLERLWFADGMNTFVADDENGEVLGTYIIKPNQTGLGNHIANCGYMVKPGFDGRGIGTALCQHSISFARENGFLGMQFNFVVSTNENAVRLWQKLGFEIIGKTPRGFRHKELGLVDTFIMFKDLTEDRQNNQI